MANELREAALSYAARGWRVFPLGPRTKEPATPHGFKDATCDTSTIGRWWDSMPDANVGIATGNGLLVLDVDDKPGHEVQGSDSLREWELEHGELSDTCRAVTGSGGVHYLLDVGDAEVPCSQSAELAIDIRCDGGYIVAPPSVHPNGNRYEWDVSPEDMPPAEASAVDRACIQWVHDHRNGGGDRAPVTIPAGVLHDGDGRNKWLYEQGCSARAKGADDQMVEIWLTQLNAQKCSPPLPDRELFKVIGSVCTKPVGLSDEAKAASAKKAGRPRKFEHNKVARKLIDEYGACRIDGVTPAIRGEDGLYRMGWEAFDAAIIDMHDDCTESNRREVKGYIRAKAPIRRQSPWNLIAFENGVLDILTMELREIGPEDVIPNKVPHRWNPDATNDVLFHVLDRMACGDTATLMNLQEFIGICMMRSNTRMPYYPVLIGSGSNGKSTYIKLLKDVLGQENISALQPKEISAHFMGEHIVGKTANLGDDIADAYLDGEDCGAIKRISTGENIFTDVKGTKGFYFEPYCTMVFSCNAFPRCKDTTEGFLRRLFPIEFNAKFSADDPDFDPLIGEKLREESALEYACMVGVEGLRRAIAQNQPTPNRMSGEVKSNIASESNTALQWFNDARLTREDIAGKTKEEVYNEYHAWCERNGYGRTAMSSGTLAAQIGTFWHMKCTGTDHRTYATGRKTVRVFE